MDRKIFETVEMPDGSIVEREVPRKGKETKDSPFGTEVWETKKQSTRIIVPNDNEIVDADQEHLDELKKEASEIAPVIVAKEEDDLFYYEPHLPRFKEEDKVIENTPENEQETEILIQRSGKSAPKRVELHENTKRQIEAEATNATNSPEVPKAGASSLAEKSIFKDQEAAHKPIGELTAEERKSLRKDLEEHNEEAREALSEQNPPKANTAKTANTPSATEENVSKAPTPTVEQAPKSEEFEIFSDKDAQESLKNLAKIAIAQNEWGKKGY